MASKIKSVIAHTAIYLLLLGGAIAVASGTGLIVVDRPAGQPSATIAERPTKQIGVHGKVRNLYPGVTRQLRIRVSNRYPRPVRLVSVRSRDANANAICTKNYLTIKRWRGNKLVRSGRHVTVAARVRLKPTAPDECQGARWPIKYKARVKR